MTWAQRLKRVFSIDVESCVRCGKAVKVIAGIEEPALIERIPEHVRAKGANSAASLGPPSTEPPVSARAANTDSARIGEQGSCDRGSAGGGAVPGRGTAGFRNAV